MKSNWEEDMKEIAFEAIVQLFVPKEEHKYYYDLMDTVICMTLWIQVYGRILYLCGESG